MDGSSVAMGSGVDAGVIVAVGVGVATPMAADVGAGVGAGVGVGNAPKHGALLPSGAHVGRGSGDDTGEIGDVGAPRAVVFNSQAAMMALRAISIKCFMMNPLSHFVPRLARQAARVDNDLVVHSMNYAIVGCHRRAYLPFSKP
jgi:hypothetical protein